MKKCFILIMAAAVSAVFADPKDPVLNAGQLEQIHSASPSAPSVKVEKPRRVLLFTRTSGYRHRDGIVGAREALSYMGEKLGTWELVPSEDISEFEVQNLKKYDAVILCHTTGDFFGKENAKKCTQNLIDYVAQGGGLFAIHAGVDCYNHPPYENKAFTDMLGGQFVAHPWCGNNPPVTVVIDDMKSPITKGIWKKDGFKISDEIYMVGSSYDRNKCRVLMRIDVDRSPVVNEWGRNKPIRADKDVAMIWIKNFGKGRVAYGAFAHGWGTYKDSKIQELYMRLLQFACGDLKADVSPLPFTGKSVCVAMSEKPSFDEIKALSELKYGEKDAEINKIIFAVCANNFDAKYCSELEEFVYSELNAKSGTPLYRGLLAELLWATKVDSKYSSKFARIAKDTDDDSIRSRVENAVAHFKAHGKMPFKKSPKFEIPSDMPTDEAVVLRTIRFLQRNPKAEIPSWLKLSAVEGDAKAQMVYLLTDRNVDMAEVFKLKSQSRGMTEALAYAAAKRGNLDSIGAVLSGASFLDGRSRAVVSSYLASIKSKQLIENLCDRLKSAKGAEATLIIDTLTKFELDKMVAKLFEGFDKMSQDMKLGSLKVAISIGSRDVFVRCAKIFPYEKDKKVRAELSKTMLKCAQNDFGGDMFAAVKVAAQKIEKTEKSLLLRFAAFAGDSDAIEFCKDAYREGLKEESIKALGAWRNQSALVPLLAIAKASKNEREKTLAQMAMVDVGQRCGIDGDTLAYLVKSAMRADEREGAVNCAVKFPTSETATVLEQAGFKEQAKKARENLSKIKTAYMSFRGDNTTPAHDGNPQTRWSSNTPMKAGDWFAIDFGYTKKVSEIVFNLESSKNDFPNKVEVFAGASMDSLQRVDFTFDYSGNKATIKFAALKARVIKVVCAENKTAYWWSIHEIAIK